MDEWLLIMWADGEIALTTDETVKLMSMESPESITGGSTMGALFGSLAVKDTTELVLLLLTGVELFELHSPLGDELIGKKTWSLSLCFTDHSIVSLLTTFIDSIIVLLRLLNTLKAQLFVK